MDGWIDRLLILLAYLTLLFVPIFRAFLRKRYYDHETGELMGSGSWDTHGSSTTTASMTSFVKNIPKGDIVIVATYVCMITVV